MGKINKKFESICKDIESELIFTTDNCRDYEIDFKIVCINGKPFLASVYFRKNELLEALNKDIKEIFEL